MLKFPIFKPNLTPAVVAGEGVLLLSENGARALHGGIYEAIAPLLDGQHSVDDIVDAMSARWDGATIYYALALLEKNGHVCEPTAVAARQTAAFWQELGVAPQQAVEAIASRRVRVRAVGEAVDTAPITAALAGTGVTLVGDDTADLLVVISDDYLRAALTEIDAEARRDGRPWLLLKPTGLEPWVGPLFVPEQTGCHSCLSRRLSRNRPIHQFIVDKQGLPEPPATAIAGLPGMATAACLLATVEVLKHLAGVETTLTSKVWSLDLRTLESRIHVLLKDPGCPRCGEPAARREPVPVILTSRKVAFVQDGGHRSVPPEQTLKRYQHLVSPITGVVNQLVPVHSAEGVAHVYVAGHNHAFRIDRLDFLKRSLRNASAGKGVSETQARASALCEAIERYSGEATGAEILRKACFKDLGTDAIHPNAVMCYSDRQYAERRIWNARKSKFNSVPEPLDDDTPIDWTPVWSLTEARHKFLPTQLVYYRAKATDGNNTKYCIGCSNGNASGNNLEEAILQGFFELVERDAVALWWYNRLAKPGVEIASFGEPYLLDLAAYYDTLGRSVWALDVTSDLGIPAFVAVSRILRGPQEGIVFGFGCHFDARIALQRAFAEMNQMLWLAQATDAEKTSSVEDAETVAWLETATLANQPCMVPAAVAAPRRLEDFPRQHSGDLLQDILLCRKIVETAGMEMLVLDQTRPDVGMPVAKVIVPGLRHFWARFAPGRLYDVPVAMGWLDDSLEEAALNPIPIFF